VIAVAADRLSKGLGSLESTFEDELSLTALGVLPSTGMPGLTGNPDLLKAVFNTPVMVTLLQCPSEVITGPKSALPDAISKLPRAAHVQLVDSRTVLGVKLLSGTESVDLVTSAGGVDNATITFPAPFPMAISLTPPASAPLAMGGDPGSKDQISVPASTGAFLLKFTPEAGADLRNIFYDILLRRIEANSGLVTERVYTVLAPPPPGDVADRSFSVWLDGALLTTGTDYTFEIHTYSGHPKASRGDLSAVSYPYGATIITTRTFKIMPS
jgi:hypothetical protein